MTQLGGAERVAGRLARRYPDAALFTSAHDRATVPIEPIGGRAWRTSFLQPIALRTGLKATLPLLPFAVASLPVGEYEQIVSSSSAFGHHVRKAPGATHVCYCHSPARFLWSGGIYFRGREGLGRGLAPLLALLRRLDLQAARRVDAYIAVSKHIQARIREVYGRESELVYPPVDVSAFTPTKERSGRFLVLSRLVPSKRVDLVIEAANQFELPLDVIGTGTELTRLRALAGPTVRLLGWQPDEVARAALAQSDAVVVAGEEDFGLVTAEAQAAGRPPVAFAAGGALEIVEDGVTGYLFSRPTPEAIAEAMLKARAARWDTADLVTSARRFDLPVFLERFDEALLTARSRAASAPAVADQLAVDPGS
jgi:glycosyltransferase involved in cell wall biosynthesis